jgi:hypothetical protein
MAYISSTGTIMPQYWLRQAVREDCPEHSIFDNFTTSLGVSSNIPRPRPYVTWKASVWAGTTGAVTVSAS